MLNETPSSPSTETMFLHFSGLLKKDILDCNERFIGRVWDIYLTATEVYPVSLELIIRKGSFRRAYAEVPWSAVAEIDGDITLNLKFDEIKFHPEVKEYDFLLKRDILDQQVVDTFNHKVRRVNDIHLLKVDHELMVAHVEIGLRGLLRRLGWEAVVDFLVKLFNKQARYLYKEDLVSWKYVQPVTLNPASTTMKLSVSQKQLSSIPPADLVEIIFDLNLKQRMTLFRSLDIKVKAKILENLEPEDQNAILKELDKKEAAQIVSNMSPDEAADLLEQLPPGSVKNLLTLIESSRAKKLSTLLGYASDSAGGLMTTDFVSIPENTTVGNAIEYIKNQTREFETVSYIFIVDEKNRLKGMTTLRRLLFANPQETVAVTALPKAFFVHLNDDVKSVAYMMDKYKVSAISVVDENKVLQGIITVDDILSQVISIAWRKRPHKSQAL